MFDNLKVILGDICQTRNTMVLVFNVVMPKKQMSKINLKQFHKLKQLVISFRKNYFEIEVNLLYLNRYSSLILNGSNINSYYGEPSRNNKLLRLPERKIDRVKIIIYLENVLKTQSLNYVFMLLSHNVKVRFFQRETF